MQVLPHCACKFIKLGIELQKVNARMQMKPVQDRHTLVDLQGKLDRKFTVSIQLGFDPCRVKDLAMWPKDPAENYERLANAGLPEDRRVPKCIRCGGELPWLTSQ